MFGAVSHASCLFPISGQGSGGKRGACLVEHGHHQGAWGGGGAELELEPRPGHCGLSAEGTLGAQMSHVPQEPDSGASLSFCLPFPPDP